jgi:hypothetical protein
MLPLSPIPPKATGSKFFCPSTPPHPTMLLPAEFQREYNRRIQIFFHQIFLR